jgi:dTDP-4-amino-4,6-dideoxygalactose transaminase
MDFSLVLPVATFACPFEGQVWDRFSDETGVPVIIDAAAGFGNQTVGSKTPVCFSLHATKPFGVGEGGFMASGDGDLVAQVRRLSNFGFEKGQVVRAGTNAKLSEYAAAIGLTQLDRWAGLQVQRRTRWQHYASELKKLPGVFLQAGFGATGIPSNVVVRHERAEKMRLQCAASGIETRPWYCPPLHQQAAFREMSVLTCLEQQKLSQSEQLGQFTIGLPWHDDLTDGDITRISTQLQAVCQSPRTVRS